MDRCRHETMDCSGADAAGRAGDDASGAAGPSMFQLLTQLLDRLFIQYLSAMICRREIPQQCAHYWMRRRGRCRGSWTAHLRPSGGRGRVVPPPSLAPGSRRPTCGSPARRRRPPPASHSTSRCVPDFDIPLFLRTLSLSSSCAPGGLQRSHLIRSLHAMLHSSLIPQAQPWFLHHQQPPFNLLQHSFLMFVQSKPSWSCQALIELAPSMQAEAEEAVPKMHSVPADDSQMQCALSGRWLCICYL